MSLNASHQSVSRVPGGLARLLGRPKVLAVGCIAALVAAGWAYLGLLLAGQSGTGFLQILCQPLYGLNGPPTLSAALLTFAMWCAMALAMMLPTAAPMIVTYAEIAETAAAKNEPAASPLMLAAGYLLVWFAIAFGLTALQLVLTRFSILDAAMASTSVLLSGELLLVAGVYQFSALKHACLKQCQHPIPFFFANWTAEPAGLFRLGLRQGLYCLGCCWAMMLLMFAMGVMNVIWMALLGVAMTIEKLDTTMRFTRALGVVFLGAGAVLTGQALIALWPAMFR
jgi:predicted metal-binding membrane protein